MRTRGIKKITMPTWGLLLVLSLSACATSSPTEKSANDRLATYLEASSSALTAHDFAGALSYAMQAEKIDPSSSPVQHIKALIFAARGDRTTAIACARKALELDPKSSAVGNTLGKLLLDEGRGSEAEPYLLMAARDPLNREAYKAWTNLGIYYYRKKEYSSAANAMDQAINAEPQNACVAFYYRGHIRMSEGKLREAIRDYDSSTRNFCAEFADGRLALGIAYERDRQFEKARRTYLEIIDRFKDNPQIAESATQHLKYLP
jgi:Tfp pilus assembly protein PilF